MSVRIRRFEWDEFNISHLEHAHPHIQLRLLEEIVLKAKSYVAVGRDRYGKKVYVAKRGGLAVLFNLKPGGTARIFSVREA